jgi:hypothetical protein
MSAERPRVGSDMLIVKGAAIPTPDVAPSHEPPDQDVDLSALGRDREPVLTFTYRLSKSRHERLRQLAHDNKTSIQAILDEALRRIGIS